MSPSRRKRWIVLSGLGVVAAVAGAGFWEWPVTYYDGFTGAWIWLRGFRGRWIAVNGYRLHYLVDGPEEGPPVVLLHGLGGRAQNWRNFAPYLAKAGFRVYMPDLLGFGRSDQPEDFSYSVGDEASVILAFIRALGLSSIDLGGWSMGGWVAQLVAAQAPDLVRHLMIFDSAGLHVYPKWKAEIFTPTTPEQLESLNAIMNPKPSTIPGFIARGIIRYYEPYNWVIRRALGAMFSGRDVTEKILPTLKMPVFLGWGGSDKCIPVDQAERMHGLIPDSELHAIPGCGHLAPLDCARHLGPKAVAFLKQGQGLEPEAGVSAENTAGATSV